MKFLLIFTAIFTLLFQSASAQEETKPTEKNNLTNIPVSTVLDQSVQFVDKKFTLELFSYEEYVYSQSTKTEIGDQMRLNTRFRYQINDNAWTSIGFKTDPDFDRSDNKTSDFELRSGYLLNDITVQADFSINTNDDDGGISFGLDLDSENTFLRYKINDKLQLTFFPFNFDGEVGVEFETDDVTRIFFIDGSPTNIGFDPDPNDSSQRLAHKTVPGFELRYSNIKNKKHLTSFYGGLGVATYEYPNDPNFDIRSSTGSGTGATTNVNGLWARKETFGYKLGTVLRRRNLFASFQYVGHTEDFETGSLLKSAFSLYGLSYLGRSLVLETELTASEGGKNPYRVNFSEGWFDRNDSVLNQITQRVYSDITQSRQDWVGKWGGALSLKLGLRKEKFTPYVSYKYQDENFVFRGRESAHELRTNNLVESHGGLHRIGLGSYFYSGNFIINPRFEYYLAQNNVFSDNALITDFNIAANLTDNDYVFFINVSYFFDKRTGPRTFRL